MLNMTMHILIVGRPRCRTSFLSMAYTDHYKLNNLHEFFYNGSSNLWLNAKVIKSSNVLEEVQKLHIKRLKNISSQILNVDNTIVKLFPRDIITHYSPNHIFLDIKDFQYRCVTNISEIFQLDRYDQILLLERNFIDSAISYIYGKIIGIMLFERHTSKNFYQKKLTPITVTKEQLDILNFYILEYLVDQNLKDFLEKKYSCKKLDFNEIPNYVKDNFNNYETNYYMDLEINYKNSILNYNEVIDYINLKFNEYSSIYLPTKFV